MKQTIHLFLIVISICWMSCHFYSSNKTNEDIDVITSSNDAELITTTNVPQTVLSGEETEVLSSVVAKKIIELRATDVLHLLAKKDVQTLADYIHPIKGVRFSPYPYVDVNDDRVISAVAMRSMLQDRKKYFWGYEDGIGDSIYMNFLAYYQRYVYNIDFKTKAEKVGYNEVIGQGNTINNRREVYPKSIIVEYYYPGGPDYGGMDWGGLTFVFEKHGAQWYLVGVIHGEWTS